MNANDAVAILRKHNEWRRADPPEGPDDMPDMPSACSARDIGVAIDVLCNEIERLRAALEDIADPIAAWQRDLRHGYTLDGGMCKRIANDPETYRRMARAALTPNTQAQPPSCRTENPDE